MTDPNPASPNAPPPPETAGPGMKPFFVLWTGQALSLVGTRAVQFALVWWLTVETGSASILATATLFALLPQILMGPVVGALVDRWNRKLTMLLSDTFVALASALLAYLFFTGTAGVAEVLILMLARAIGGAFHGPAMTASTSLMVPRRHLSRIQGFNQMLQGGMNIVSAPLGALLIGLLSMPAVVLVDVVTALFGIVPLILIHVPEPERKAAEPGSARRTVLGSELAAGIRYLRERRGHLALVSMASLVNLCLVPGFALLPLLVREELGGDAAHLAWLSSAVGVGTLTGGLLLGVWGGFSRRILTALSGLVGLGAATAALGLVPASLFAAATAILFVVGFMAPMTNGPILAVMQATIAPDYQGRVFTLMSSVAAGMMPLGLLLAAPVADLVGVRAWYLIGGAVCLGMGIAAFFVRAIMEIESPPAAHGYGASPSGSTTTAAP